MDKRSQSQKRARRTRHQLKSRATASLRLSVFRSNTNIYAQIIDDEKSVTVVSASTVAKDIRKGVKKPSSVEAAKTVGEVLAKKAKEAGVGKVYFDRGGYRYHGRVKALAEAARQGGLAF